MQKVYYLQTVYTVTRALTLIELSEVPRSNSGKGGVDVQVPKEKGFFSFYS
jgi:hypothetical protein